MSLALEGIKVVDVSQAVAVPMAARHLGDFGADVIHIEPPATGDSWRTPPDPAAGPPTGALAELDSSFEAFNRNKRSLALDISRGEGLAALYRLIGQADVFLTNMRPSERERFGVDYATLHGRFPRLIHASLSGVGKKGPERDLPGYDATALWFRSGMHYVLAQRGIGGMGWRAGFGDTVAGMSLFAGIMTALYNRERTGVGQQVDLSLFNIGIYQLSHDMSAFLATGTDFREMIARMVEDEGDTPRMRKRAELLAAHETATRGLREFFMEQVQTPLAVHYQTKDGRNFHINILQGDRYYPRICRVIGREDLIDDPRWAAHEERTANGPELYRIMRDAFPAKTLDEWRPIMIREEIPWAPEQTIREVVHDPQARANDFFVPFDHPTYGAMEVVANPIKLSDTPATTRLPAPEFSQHTEEVLLEAGYSWEDIARFKDEGIIP